MPIAVQAAESPDDGPDWNLVQSLYLQGQTPKQIEAQTGVKAGLVSVRATRKGWTIALAKSKQVVKVERVSEDSTEVETPESNHLTQASANVKQSLANALLQATGCLDTLPQSKSLKSRSASAQLLSTLAGVGKTVFGWSEGQSSPAVRINVLSTVQVSPSPQEQKPVIELNNAQATVSEQETVKELKTPSA